MWHGIRFQASGIIDKARFAGFDLLPLFLGECPVSQTRFQEPVLIAGVIMPGHDYEIIIIFLCYFLPAGSKLIEGLFHRTGCRRAS